MRKNKIQLIILMLVLATCLGGCKKELTKEEVQETEYYQNLKKKNTKLKNKIKTLEEEVNTLSNELLELKELAEDQEGEASANQNAEEYFEKIKGSSLIQVEIGYTDNYCDAVYVKNSAVSSFAKELLQNADLTANYTPEKLKEEMGAGYVYTLYEEDDSVFQAEVYGDGYVVFLDLPGQVYYCQGSTSLGEAFLDRKGSYPNSNLLHRMADSAMVVYGKKKAWNQEKCLEIANYINSMEKREVGDNRESSVKLECTLYSYGNQMTLKIYKSHICIIAWDGEETWYQAEKEAINELKSIFS